MNSNLDLTSGNKHGLISSHLWSSLSIVTD